MAISMYQLSAPVFALNLNALLGVLSKAEAFADARKLDQAVLLGLRIYPDMFPLNRQIGQVCTHATRAIALLSGVPQPDFGDLETTIAGLRARVQKALDFVKSARPEQIDGTEDKDLLVKFGASERPFKGEAFLVGFTLTNFFFHYTTAYNILRSIGVEVGKRDFMGRA